MNHIFYDFETTGLDTGYDQVLQFAAIATDENMRELPNGRLNMRCNLMPHIIPSPGALIVTGVRPRLLTGQDLCHREFMRTIQKWSSQWGPSTFWGYNNIAFDENLMRQGLYQTLHNPYLTNTNGNTRADVMRLAHAAYLFAPGSIAVPTGAKGKPTFALGAFAAENGITFNKAEAHDALYDVQKTIEVAHLIKENAPGVWQAMAKNSVKSAAIDFIRNQEIFAAGAMYASSPYRWAMTHCGTNTGNPAEMAGFDLNFDPAEYLEMSVDELVDALGSKTKVIRTLKANAQPFVMAVDALSAEYWDDISADLEECRERAQIIKENTDFQARVGEAMSLRYEDQEESEHIEDNIYKGFPSKADQVLMDRFHDSAPQDRVLMIDKFEDTRYREIAKRLIFFETPDALPANIRAEMIAWQRERLTTANECPWRTIPAALVELGELRADNQDAAHLQEIEDFINTLMTGLAA